MIEKPLKATMIEKWQKITAINTIAVIFIFEVLTALQRRDVHPNLNGNIRDHDSINKIICLSNMENLNAVFINESLTQKRQIYKV